MLKFVYDYNSRLALPDNLPRHLGLHKVVQTANSQVGF